MKDKITNSLKPSLTKRDFAVATGNYMRCHIGNAEGLRLLKLIRAPSCLRQFWGTENPLKMMKKRFLFHFKSSFCSHYISVFGLEVLLM